MDKPFGIYIHWPFCAAKCPYCDFNSHVRMGGVDQERYVAAFQMEMSSMRARTGPRLVSSIFIGGGTPSLMKPETVENILKAIAQNWNIAENAEITMEANPSSVEADRFKAYRGAGVNRLSLGVQALDDEELRRLGRLHNVEQALYAIGLARDIFPRLSFDLIYARPNQTLVQWERELNQAIDLAADHLSLYQLTIEENTAYHRLYQAGKLKMLEPEIAADLYDMTQHVTAARGLPAYEISNHAVLGAESQHNLLYWRYHEYAGIGPGAHGRFVEQTAFDKVTALGQVSLQNSGNIKTVTITEKMPERWLELVEAQGHGVVEEEHLTQDEQADEMLLMGLRLHEGLDTLRYEAMAGRALSDKTLHDLQAQGLMEFVGNHHIRATASGRIVLDHIILQLAS